MVKVEILLAGENEAHLEAARDSSSRPGTGFNHLKFNNLGHVSQISEDHWDHWDSSMSVVCLYAAS